MYPCLSKCASLWNSFCQQPNPFKKEAANQKLTHRGRRKAHCPKKWNMAENLLRTMIVDIFNQLKISKNLPINYCIVDYPHFCIVI